MFCRWCSWGVKGKPTSPHSAFLRCLKVKRNQTSLTSNSTFLLFSPPNPSHVLPLPSSPSLPAEQKGSKAAATPSPKAFGSQQLSPHKSSLIIQQRANFNLSSHLSKSQNSQAGSEPPQWPFQWGWPTLLGRTAFLPRGGRPPAQIQGPALKLGAIKGSAA